MLERKTMQKQDRYTKGTSETYTHTHRYCHKNTKKTRNVNVNGKKYFLRDTEMNEKFIIEKKRY